MHLGQGQHRSDVSFSQYPMRYTWVLLLVRLIGVTWLRCFLLGFSPVKLVCVSFQFIDILRREFATIHISYFSSNCHLLILVSFHTSCNNYYCVCKWRASSLIPYAFANQDYLQDGIWNSCCPPRQPVCGVVLWNLIIYFHLNNSFEG